MEVFSAFFDDSRVHCLQFDWWDSNKTYDEIYFLHNKSILCFRYKRYLSIIIFFSNGLWIFVYLFKGIIITHRPSPELYRCQKQGKAWMPLKWPFSWRRDHHFKVTNGRGWWWGWRLAVSGSKIMVLYCYLWLELSFLGKITTSNGLQVKCCYLEWPSLEFQTTKNFRWSLVF